MEAGYAITTYKMQLNYRHLDWIKATNTLYNDVLIFYYDLLKKNVNLLAFSNQNLLRQLELKTIKQRNGTLPETPLPFEKVPLYFRRAAINAAISTMRIYVGEVKTYEAQKAKAEKETRVFKYNPPNPPQKINASMVYYKGMYKAFDTKSILLKLYNGKSWVWMKHPFTGRAFPKNAEIMSPTIVLKQKKVMLHVPVKEKVEDTRTAKVRVKDNEKFCAVALTGSDALAVCTILNADGSATNPYFIKGGKKLAHRRKQLLGYAKRSLVKTKTKNSKYYRKITAVTDHYAHDVSRKIVDHAVKYGAKLIVLPDLEESLRNHQKFYLGNTTFSFIGRRIIEYTRYKAWQNGIVTMTSRPYYASSRCYYCGEEIKKYNKEWQPPNKNFYGGKNYICETGHQGSTHLNTARNIGKAFYEAFYQKIA
ncbi:MAG: transposase [Eubacterium sp.]